MKNNKGNIKFKNKILYFISLTNWRIFLFYKSIFFISIIFANESFSKEIKEEDDRNLIPRFAENEPEFLTSGTNSQWGGFYFGVGFRKIKLKVSDDVIVNDSDGEANGIGVNLGYIWEDQGVEFERQISIIKHTKPLTFDTHEGIQLEVIQNNLWYIRYPKINRFLYLHYGAGIQFTKTRFSGTQRQDTFKDEIAFGIEAGSSYFITSNMLIFYRYALGQQVPLFSSNSKKVFLNQSQIHTIYFNYYFPL